MGERAHHVVARVAELDPLEQVADAPPGVGDAVHVGVEAQVLLGGEVAVQQRVVRDEADRPAHRHGVVLEVVAGDRDVPDEGRSSVATRRSVVVLPAPLGPNSVRNPPRATVNDTSRSTSRRPKALPSPSTRISGG